MRKVSTADEGNGLGEILSNELKIFGDFCNNSFTLFATVSEEDLKILFGNFLVARINCRIMDVLRLELDVREMGNYEERFSILLSIQHSQHSILDSDGYSLSKDGRGTSSHKYTSLL